MEIIKKKVKIDNLNKNDLVIDLETSGFSPDYCSITILGYIIYVDNSFYSIQLFSNNGDDQDLIRYFLDDISQDKRFITFNGMAFDIPFLQKRINKHGMDYDLDNKNIDLYAYIRNNQDFSPYPLLGQNKLEKVYGIERDSDLDGKTAVNLYKKYLNNPDAKIKDTLLYYNYLDIYNLSKLFDIYKEIRDNKTININDKTFLIGSTKVDKDSLYIDLSSLIRPSFEILINASNFSLNWQDQIEIRADLIEGLINRQVEGKVFDGKSLSMATNNSPYPLQDGLVLVESDKLHTENIKSIAKEIIRSSLKNYIDYI